MGRGLAGSPLSAELVAIFLDREEFGLGDPGDLPRKFGEARADSWTRAARACGVAWGPSKEQDGEGMEPKGY